MERPCSACVVVVGGEGDFDAEGGREGAREHAWMEELFHPLHFIGKNSCQMLQFLKLIINSCDQATIKECESTYVREGLEGRELGSMGSSFMYGRAFIQFFTHETDHDCKV